MADSGFDGLVIRLDKNFGGIHWNSSHEVQVRAGTPLMKLALETLRAGYGDLMFASGIPGTVGGALRMNAGAYGGEISKILTRLKILNGDLQLRELSQTEVSFGYRSSSLTDVIILEGEFSLHAPSDPDTLMEKRKELVTKRRETQPLNYPNAGSVFKNPEGKPSAGYLLEKARLKGIRQGDAQISEKHANFIVNLGQATAGDVAALIRLARSTVSDQFGITLELEIKTLGVVENL